MEGSKKEDFFLRKTDRKIDIPACGDYDPTNSDDLLSCGIKDMKSFEERHNDLFKSLVVDSNKENPVATVAKRFEESFSKRELAFLISKDLLITSFQEAKKDINKV